MLESLLGAVAEADSDRGAAGEYVPADVRTTPEDVAEAVVAGVRDERFLILPHPEVEGYFRMRGDDHERWLRGMRRLHAQAVRPAPRSEGGGGRPEDAR
jgi:hypothetical protein